MNLRKIFDYIIIFIAITTTIISFFCLYQGYLLNQYLTHSIEYLPWPTSFMVESYQDPIYFYELMIELTIVYILSSILFWIGIFMKSYYFVISGFLIIILDVIFSNIIY